MRQRRKKQKSAGRAASLSAFLFPGAGQIYNGQKIKGAVVIIATCVLVFLFCLSVAQFITNYAMGMANIASGADPGPLLPDIGTWWLWVILLSIVYAFSIVDAYIEGRKLHPAPLDAQPLD